MFKKISLFYYLILLLNFHTSHADKGLYLIQVTQPEKQCIDIVFYPFFFLENQEEVALRQMSNKHTLFTYEELQAKKPVLQKQIGPVTVSIKTQSLGHGGAGGSAQGIEVSVSYKDHKVLDQVIFKNDDFTKVSIIYKDDTIILSFKPDPKSQIQNYQVKTDIQNSLKSYEDIKTQGTPL